MTYASNSPKRIMFSVSLNIKFGWMKEDQVKKNNGEQVSPSLHKPSNNSKNIALQKSLNINLYGVSSTSKAFPTWVLGNIKKKTSRFCWNTCFLRLSTKKMIIFLTWLLSKNTWRIQRNMCILFNFVQIFVNVVKLCCKPNINFELIQAWV